MQQIYIHSKLINICISLFFTFIPWNLAYVPKYRCAVNECETVNTASYYKREVLPFYEANDINFNYSKFVELGIGLIDPSSSIDDVGKTCKKINPSKQEFGPAITETNTTTTCEALQNKISGYFTNGYIIVLFLYL